MKCVLTTVEMKLGLGLEKNGWVFGGMQNVGKGNRRGAGSGALPVFDIVGQQ